VGRLTVDTARCAAQREHQNWELMRASKGFPNNTRAVTRYTSDAALRLPSLTSTATTAAAVASRSVASATPVPQPTADAPVRAASQVAMAKVEDAREVI
jgi:hypothetical protein